MIRAIMIRGRRYLRHIFVWGGSAALLIFILLTAFLYCALGTAWGSRWLVNTAVSQVGGSVKGIEGTVLSGLKLDELLVDIPSVYVDAKNASLKVNWSQLFNRRARIDYLRVDDLLVKLKPAQTPVPETASAPFVMPSLPVTVDVGELAVNKFAFEQADGTSLPVGLSQFKLTDFLMNNNGASTKIENLNVQHELANVDLQSDIKVEQLKAPWPVNITLNAKANTQNTQSPLCIKQFLPAQMVAQQGDDCALTLNTTLQGSLQEMAINLSADGQGLKGLGTVNLDLQSAFPLRDSNLDLSLADGSGIKLKADWLAGQGKDGSDRLSGHLETSKLALDKFAAGKIPPALLNAKGDFVLDLLNQKDPQDVALNLQISDSRWNKENLAGTIDIQADLNGLMKSLAATDAQSGKAKTLIDPSAILIPKANIDLTLGRNKIQTQGGFGKVDSQLRINANTPSLASFWPGIPGAAKLTAQINGSVAKHTLDLKGSYQQGKSMAIGKAPADVEIKLAGIWGKLANGLEGWQGHLVNLQASHAGFAVKQSDDLSIMLAPQATDNQNLWQLGASDIQVTLPGKHQFVIKQAGASGGKAHWQTKGALPKLAISPKLINDVMAVLSPASAARSKTNKAIKERGSEQNDLLAKQDLVFNLDWDLAFKQGLQGHLNLKRTGGDVIIPIKPQQPLGLSDLALNIEAKKISSTASGIVAKFVLATKNKGVINGQANTRLLINNKGGLAPDLKNTTASVKGNLADISWLSSYTNEQLSLAGAIDLDMNIRPGRNGVWDSSGTLNANKLNIVQLDNGIRLLNGTLRSHLSNNDFIVDSLNFPGVIRVMPTEWRTRGWIEKTPAAQKGSLNVSGHWSLLKSMGQFKVLLDHYPIVQRSDRFVMISGNVDLNAKLPNIDVTGKVTADSGWASIDILSSVPVLDGDVVILKPGQEKVEKAANSPINTSLDFTVDLGPRFYIVGLGLDSGLKGAINIVLKDTRMTAVGSFQTRGGAIDAYGQHLQIKRGFITFQGNIANPILDIEALRTNLEVNAGVKVSGTAQKPKIALVSYPNVDDIAKLSWLIMSRGPDGNASDAALLLSIGGSMIGGSGEPFYKKFGVDDVSVRTGGVGQSGTILPQDTVASGTNANSGNDVSSQFVVASKKFNNGFRVSVEQALAGTGTVLRGSYQLLKHLSVDAKVGNINGLELVYRRIFWD